MTQDRYDDCHRYRNNNQGARSQPQQRGCQDQENAAVHEDDADACIEFAKQQADHRDQQTAHSYRSGRGVPAADEFRPPCEQGQADTGEHREQSSRPS